MRMVITAVSIGLLAAMAGCNQGTSGGPGATTPPSKESMVSQADDTFSLDLPSASLNQGETKSVSVEISRGKNFDEDVSLKLTGLPSGVTLEPISPLIERGNESVDLRLKAGPDAALGDFTVTVTGHPTKGADAVSETKLSIAKVEPKEIADSAAMAAQEKWNEYTLAMQTQFEQYTEKYEEMEAGAVKLTGKARTDLNLKLVALKEKLSEAAVKLQFLKSSGSDRWENTKDGVSEAFRDLEKSFA